MDLKISTRSLRSVSQLYHLADKFKYMTWKFKMCILSFAKAFKQLPIWRVTCKEGYNVKNKTVSLIYYARTKFRVDSSQFEFYPAGYSKKFYTGRFRPGVQTITPFHIQLLAEKVTLAYTLDREWYPLRITTTDFFTWITVRLFDWPFQILNDSFPYPLVYYNSCNPYPCTYLEPEKIAL